MSVGVVALLLLAGCAHPTGRTAVPRPVAVAAFTFAQAEAVGPVAAPWWTTFGNAELDTLVERALAGSLTVGAARARLDQADAVRARVRAGNRPELSLAGGWDRDVKRAPLRSDSGEIGAQLTAEVDIFGRLHALEAVREWEWSGARERLAAARLAVTATTVELYYGVVAQRQLLALLAQQRDTAETVLGLIERRYTEGLISRLDVLQQQGQVAEIATLVPAVERELRTLELQLAVVAGEAPDGGGTVALEAGFAELPVISTVAVPGDLLGARPDLRAARADLLAADAEVGRAVAERWPKLSLSGSSLWLDGRDTYGSPVVALAANLVQPLVDWGERRAEVTRVGAVVRERLALYSQAYLRAVAELETAMAAEINQRQLLARLEDRATILRETLRQAERRYASGLTDYLAVLSVTQQLFAVEQRLVRERRELMSVRVEQHAGMGGPMPVVEDSEAETGSEARAAARASGRGATGRQPASTGW